MAAALLALFSSLLFNLSSLRAFAILASLSSFLICPSGLGGTTFSPAIFTTIYMINIQIMLDLIIKINNSSPLPPSSPCPVRRVHLVLQMADSRR